MKLLRVSSALPVSAVSALLHEDMEYFTKIVSSLSVLGDHSDLVVQNLLVATESLLTGGEQLAVNALAQVDGESAVRVPTVIGDIALYDLLENEERSYETAAGTVLRVMAPSSERISSGFLIGPVSVPPLDGTTHQNVTVQVISWAVNLFGQGDVSDAVLTL